MVAIVEIFGDAPFLEAKVRMNQTSMGLDVDDLIYYPEAITPPPNPPNV